MEVGWWRSRHARASESVDGMIATICKNCGGKLPNVAAYWNHAAHCCPARVAVIARAITSLAVAATPQSVQA